MLPHDELDRLTPVFVRADGLKVDLRSLLAAVGATLLAGCGAANASATSLDDRLRAAVEDYCVPFVAGGAQFQLPARVRGIPVVAIESLPPENPAHQVARGWASAVVGVADQQGFVTVGGSVDGDLGPLCSVLAHGAEATAAVARLAVAMRAGSSGWSLNEQEPGSTNETLTFYESSPRNHDRAIKLFVDLRGDALGGDAVLLSRVPIWREEDHPEEPTQAELEAATHLSLGEALLAATFEVAIPMLQSPPGAVDPVLQRRLRVLTQGITDTLVMRMSTDENLVGITQGDPHMNTLAVVARGTGADRALPQIRRQLEQSGWRSVIGGNAGTPDAECYQSNDARLSLCIVSPTEPSLVRLALSRRSAR